MVKLSTTPASPRWSSQTWGILFSALTFAIVLLHGFHPFSEDGGLYAAGIEYSLDPALFPHDTAFVTGHLRFSVFAPAVALFVRTTHLPLMSALLLLDLATAWLTLLAARSLLRRCMWREETQLAGLCALAAGWTLPVAGTSLYLMDPYVTGRSVAMPFCLFAMAYALDPWPTQSARDVPRRSGLLCALYIALAALFHPLMALYGLLFVITIRIGTAKHHARGLLVLACAILFLCRAVIAVSAPAGAEERVAAFSRYYWFLSQWHWYERLGLLGPPVMLVLVLRAKAVLPAGRTLVCASLFLAGLGTVCALLFARSASAQFTIARLQPLRIFVLLYAVMLLLLGAAGWSVCRRLAVRFTGTRHVILRSLPSLCLLALAFSMFAAARATYPESPHIEWNAAAVARRNPWVAAFLWARAHTPQDALFALDARYVNTGGEDAQTFRAWSLRSALPDYSKDGGEASITPSIAPLWLAGADAQNGLSSLTPTERDQRLRPLRVTWIVLHSSAVTEKPCAYANGVVKVCRLQP